VPIAARVLRSVFSQPALAEGLAEKMLARS